MLVHFVRETSTEHLRIISPLLDKGIKEWQHSCLFMPFETDIFNRFLKNPLPVTHDLSYDPETGEYVVQRYSFYTEWLYSHEKGFGQFKLSIRLK